MTRARQIIRFHPTPKGLNMLPSLVSGPSRPATIFTGSVSVTFTYGYSQFALGQTEPHPCRAPFHAMATYPRQPMQHLTSRRFLRTCQESSS
jgi:hypothetical protein